MEAGLPFHYYFGMLKGRRKKDTQWCFKHLLKQLYSCVENELHLLVEEDRALLLGLQEW